MGEIFSMRTTWNQSIVKEMLTKFEQGPRIPTSLEQRLEKISYNSQKADLFSSNTTIQFRSALHCTWIFCHFAKFYTSNCDFTRESYTWWIILLDFAFVFCMDHDNWIMKGNTPKILVDTKPERQCYKWFGSVWTFLYLLLLWGPNSRYYSNKAKLVPHPCLKGEGRNVYIQFSFLSLIDIDIDIDQPYTYIHIYA